MTMLSDDSGLKRIFGSDSRRQKARGGPRTDGSSRVREVNRWVSSSPSAPRGAIRAPSARARMNAVACSSSMAFASSARPTRWISPRGDRPSSLPGRERTRPATECVPDPLLTPCHCNPAVRAVATCAAADGAPRIRYPCGVAAPMAPCRTCPHYGVREPRSENSVESRRPVAPGPARAHRLRPPDRRFRSRGPVGPARQSAAGGRRHRRQERPRGTRFRLQSHRQRGHSARSCLGAGPGRPRTRLVRRRG